MIPERNSSDVIYIIIVRQMKTHNNSIALQKITDIGHHNRLALALAGLVVAFICSLVLFHDHDSTHAFVQLPRMVETAKMVSVDVGLDVKKIDAASAIRTVRW